MYARITKYKMKAGSMDDAMAIMNRVKDQIMALKGLKHFYNCGNEDGSGYIVSMVENKEQSDANAENIKKIWAEFGDLLETTPSVEGFEVLADWSN